MTQTYIISGTDTDVGKTVFSSALMLALNEHEKTYYWKPVQSGIEEIDTRRVQKLTTLPKDQFLAESYIFTEPLSPHRAAEIDNAQIDIDSLEVPQIDAPLLIEGAGGLHVPLTRTTLYTDIFSMWNIPVILCTRTTLGTLNHTLLSIEALKTRNIPIHGIAFIGDDNPDNIKTISQFTGIRVLGRLPRLDELTPDSLLQAFSNNFDIDDFLV